MEAHDELGPVDIVVIAYPADAPMTGEAIPIMVDLVDRGIIRVLDVEFVIKNADGTYSGFEATGLDSDRRRRPGRLRGRDLGPARRRGPRGRRRRDRAGLRGGHHRL